MNLAGPDRGLKSAPWKMLLATVASGAVLGVFAIGCSETMIVRDNNEKPGITVTGEGSVFGEPDVAVATLGVQAEADSVGAARDQSAASMNGMIDALKSGGVEDEDIQTTQFSVEPRYDFSDNRQTLIGFTVNNIVTAKIRDIDRTGELIDAAITAGGDQARVQGLQFTIDEPKALQNEARQEAMTDARERAQTLADAAGAELGAPRSISESGGPMPIAFDAAGAATFLQEAERTPLETGQLEVVIQVSVVYELK